ncbi:SagB/ThcOx family dehydrogenase [Halanaerobium sp. Z-7514]|uniref:SagB/ThcOx family dehydrogenase n=1 Tax=Halanaerobium polyolivorans TaxID=2886943 RepID=A0AAW4X0D9_9FIRM|nr:SagB/ThcOx family dehydrogenase [Halanaerobium polyolivorans]MCC3145279.1 SagB/ThcOx family dehydrogenase [Halanaerobium polyolivorans]RQD76192.1 MAG: SagB/ThcOx family dehydrogenase [Halanaerobium sp. MSAO_Bac5]
MELKFIFEKFKGIGYYFLIAVLLFAVIFIYFYLYGAGTQRANSLSYGERVELAEVEIRESEFAELIYNRRSIRDYQAEEISFNNISKLLWSTVGTTVDGISGPTRAAPSAGATDAVEVFISAKDVENLASGIYHYQAAENTLLEVSSEAKTAELEAAALNQAAVGDGSAVVIITAVYDRTLRRYGERGERYVHMEAGHAAQNLLLMAENLGLGSVIIGAFDDNELSSILGSEKYEPLLLLPIGVLEN